MPIPTNKFSISRDKVVAVLEKLGQKKLIAHFKSLATPQQADLFAELESVDFEALKRLLKEKPSAEKVKTDKLQPVELAAFDQKTAREIGEDMIASGQVALFVVAGGQGSRLGFEGPKGCFPTTPVRRASLFQVFAEKILTAQCRSGATIPWIIMTSPQNNNQTVEYFWEKKFFGLKEEQIFFFEQGTMPAVDTKTHEMLLASPTSLALNPDGHGGAIKGLQNSGALDWLQRRSVATLSYWQVDNPLVRILDPVFLGAHKILRSQFSSKSLPKRGPMEKVGNFVRRDGRVSVIEYVDMPEALANERTSEGELRFNQGSIAIHAIDVSFIRQIAKTAALPYHRAYKKVPFWDGEKIVSPAEPNATKFEQFIFDAIPMAENSMVTPTTREEFSPIKNAEGVDSAVSCREDQLKLWAFWFKSVGVEIPCDANGVPLVNFEISPLFAETLEEFKVRHAEGRVPEKVTEGLVLV